MLLTKIKTNMSQENKPSRIKRAAPYIIIVLLLSLTGFMFLKSYTVVDKSDYKALLAEKAARDNSVAGRLESIGIGLTGSK